jgi:hypothetical protein
MTEPANPEDRDDVATSRAAVSKRVEGRYARAHQRRSVNGGEFIRHKRQRFRWRDHIFSVAAVERNARRQQFDFARKKLAAPAMIAIPTVPAMPTNADALAFLPRLNSFTDSVDDANHFVSRHARILKAGP